MSTDNFDRLLKLLIIGNSGVGKSCLLMRYSDNTFTKAFYNTIGVDFKMKNIELDGLRLKVQIWDTAGQDRFRTITSSYYRGAHGILLVYDITDRDSFSSLRYWMGEIERHAQPGVVVILVGNKLDMAAQRKVTYDQGFNFSKSNGLSFIETSALTDNNIALVFESVCRKVLHSPNFKAQEKSKEQALNKKQVNPNSITNKKKECC